MVSIINIQPQRKVFYNFHFHTHMSMMPHKTLLKSSKAVREQINILFKY